MRILIRFFNSLLSGLSFTILVVTMILTISITSMTTLFYANSFGEACGYIHPYIFQISVNVIDEITGTVSTSSVTEIPARPFLQTQDANQNPEAPELDTVLRIYVEVGAASERVLIAENDDGFGLGAAILDFQIPPDLVDPATGELATEIGDVIIEVDTYNSEGQGNFTLDVVNSDLPDVNIPSDVDVTASRILRFDENDYLRREWRIRQGRFVRYRFPRSELDSPVTIYAYGVSTNSAGNAIEASVAVSVAGLTIYTGTDIADAWASCIEHYGYFGDDGFIINANAFREFVPPSLPFRNKIIDRCADPAVDTTNLSNDELLTQVQQRCEISANVELSTRGRINLYFLLPMLVIVLPIIVAGVIAKRRGWLWFVFMIFVAIQANAAALMLVHFAQVAQIEALGEFGYGIFGGVITGAALAFLDQLMTRITEARNSE